MFIEKHIITKQRYIPEELDTKTRKFYKKDNMEGLLLYESTDDITTNFGFKSVKIPL